MLCVQNILKLVKVISCTIVLAMGFSFGIVNNAHAALPVALVPAVDQIYNADFVTANRSIQSYIGAHPQDPAGYLLRGMLSEWDQVVNNKKKVLNSQILADYEKANDLAETAYQADPDNIDKMVMLGNTDMYIAKKLVDNGHKMQGGFALKKAKELMLQAIEKNPDYNDAYMALGVFNYFSENVPSGFKWLASLLGFHGDKNKGIEYLKRAAETKNLTQGDAAFLLVYLYDDKERNHAAANRYNDILKGRYPNNPAFQYTTGEQLFRMKKYAEARKSFDQFFAFCATKPPGFCNNKYLFLAHYFVTWSFIEEKNFVEANKNLELAIKLNESQYKDRDVDLDLWTGEIAANKGDKVAALAAFKKVEDHQKQNPYAWKIAQQQIAALDQPAVK